MEKTAHLLCGPYKSASSSQQEPRFTASRASASNSDEQRRRDGGRKKRNMKWKRQMRTRELLTTSQPGMTVSMANDTSHHFISNGNLHNSVSASVKGTSLLLIRSAQDFHWGRQHEPFPWRVAWRWFIVNRFHYFYWVCGEKIAIEQHVLTIFELCGQLKMRWPSKLDWLSRGGNSFQMKGSVPKSSEPPCCLNSLQRQQFHSNGIIND